MANTTKKGWPHAPGLTVNLSDNAYAELLLMLRRDLQLDPSTDVIGNNPAGLLNLGIDRGTVALTFSGGTTSSVVTVMHRLRTVPTVVLATSIGAPAFGNIVDPNTANYTDTTFDIDGEILSAFTGTLIVGWMAVI